MKVKDSLAAEAGPSSAEHETEGLTMRHDLQKAVDKHVLYKVHFDTLEYLREI